jgi:ribulose-5-phosphate 4-epimerase/fuculose-1-phosphate aldolase
MDDMAGSGGIPVADGIKAELDKLALACRILEMEGHGSRTLGHVALRDPEGRGLWIKRWGITFGEVFDWTYFQLIDFDGKLIYGTGKRHGEWPIHAGIMKRRPDINATAHTHPAYGRIFSASDEPLLPVSNAGSYFETPPPRFTRTSELIRKAEEGDELADMLGSHLAMFMRNHGVVFCGDSIAKMTIIGIHLEEACREMLIIKSSGLKWSWPADDEQKRKFRGIGQPKNVEGFFQYFARKLAAAQELGNPALPAKRRAPA